MSIWLAIGITIFFSTVCFFLGLAVGSAGKASERERADYAVAKADDYRKRVEELEKIDLLR
ncbi:MAG: hypothetical protein IJO19_05390 [Clostridia bacterium]|nr:hypothetical protein [Clostridia bacterium]